MFQIVPAFAVPFAEAQLADCAALNAELRELILARESRLKPLPQAPGACRIAAHAR